MRCLISRHKVEAMGIMHETRNQKHDMNDDYTGDLIDEWKLYIIDDRIVES